MRQANVMLVLAVAWIYSFGLAPPCVSQAHPAPASIAPPITSPIIPPTLPPIMPPIAIERSFTEPQAKFLGYILTDMPWVVTPGKEFKIDFFLQPVEPTFNQPVPVVMEQTDLIDYTPRSFKVRPGERVTVRAMILQPSQGLSQIIYTTSAPGWVTPWVTVNSGFQAGLSLTLPAMMDSGTVGFFSVQFVDEATGKRVALGAPTSLLIEASSAEIRYGGGPWSRVLKLDLLSGANSSPVLELRPNYWPPGRGALKAELRLNSQRIIADKVVELVCAPSWWSALLMAAIGGLLWSLYSLAKDFKTITTGPRRRIAAQLALTLFGGLFAGSLAYLLASWDIFGIRVDTSSLRGFVFLGFLFAYIGVDSLMKGISSKVPGRT
jgi:hypothetical protein